MNFRTDGDIRALLKGGVQKWQEKQNHSYKWKMAKIKQWIASYHYEFGGENSDRDKKFLSKYPQRFSHFFAVDKHVKTQKVNY